MNCKCDFEQVVCWFYPQGEEVISQAGALYRINVAVLSVSSCFLAGRGLGTLSRISRVSPTLGVIHHVLLEICVGPIIGP